MSCKKRLIINADDYGSCVEVNRAIEELAQSGFLGGISVLPNGECWTDVLEFANRFPNVSIGIHLNFIEGAPVAPREKVAVLLTSDGTFTGRNALLRRWVKQPRQVANAIAIEATAQIQRLQNAGLTINHADSHQHLHAFFAWFGLIAQTCRDLNITSLRLPNEQNKFAGRRIQATLLRFNLKIATSISSHSGFRTNDHFLGFQRVGTYRINELLTDLRELKDGITELAVHPSLTNQHPYPDLRGCDETLALLSAEFSDEIKQLNIELISWNQI